jgi:hypothetical protein
MSYLHLPALTSTRLRPADALPLLRPPPHPCPHRRSPASFRAAGLPASAAHQAGHLPGGVLQAGYSAEEVASCGASLAQLCRAGMAAPELLAALGPAGGGFDLTGGPGNGLPRLMGGMMPAVA